MAHEKSISVKIGAQKFANFKTVFNKKQLNQGQVMDMFDRGDLKPLGGKTFPTMDAAVDAAGKRSRSSGKR